MNGVTVHLTELQAIPTQADPKALGRDDFHPLTWGRASVDAGGYFDPARPQALVVPAGAGGLYGVAAALVTGEAVAGSSAYAYVVAERDGVERVLALDPQHRLAALHNRLTPFCLLVGLADGERVEVRVLQASGKPMPFLSDATTLSLVRLGDAPTPQPPPPPGGGLPDPTKG